MCLKWKLLGLCFVAGLVCCGQALAAGSTSNPTIDEVWMRHGGARPYYDVLSQPTQMDMRGMRRKDPALIRNLPPIKEVKPQPRRSSRAAVSAKPSGKTVDPAATGLPAGQSTSAKPAANMQNGIKATPAAVPPGNGQRIPAAGGNGTQGALQPTQNNDDVFVPPPKAGGFAGPTPAASALSGASTSSMGNGGRMAGSGQTSGANVPAFANSR